MSHATSIPPIVDRPSSPSFFGADPVAAQHAGLSEPQSFQHARNASAASPLSLDKVAGTGGASELFWGGMGNMRELPPGAGYAPSMATASGSAQGNPGYTGSTAPIWVGMANGTERRSLSHDRLSLERERLSLKPGERSLTEPLLSSATVAVVGTATTPIAHPSPITTRPSLPLPPTPLNQPQIFPASINRTPLPSPPVLPLSNALFEQPLQDEPEDDREEEEQEANDSVPALEKLQDRRPSLPRASTPPNPSQPLGNPSARSDAPADSSRPPLQFSPVAAMIPLPASPPHLPPVATTTSSNRQSFIPAFVPNPAFSSDRERDRGPYPSPPQRSSVITPPLPSNARDSYFGAGGNPGINIMSMEGPYPNMSVAKGKQRDSDEVDINRRASKFYSNTVAVARDDNGRGAAGSAGGPSGAETRSSIVRGTSFDLNNDMVGIGRNSIIRPNGTLSPTFSNQLLGPGPQAAGISSAKSSAAAANGGPQQQPLPPHLVPQPEICVECMMRDRDMIDVDVTGEGVWERESDQDWDEAVRWEMSHENELTNSEESGRRGSASGSRESAGGHRLPNGPGTAGMTRKRIGRGMLLTSSNLKVWTNMNPPASSHRWRTLQSFLATQNHLLELERHAHELTAAERDRAAASHQQQSNSRSSETRQSAPALLGAMGRPRTSTVLPNGLVVEKINIDKDEKYANAAVARSRGVSQTRETVERSQYQRQSGVQAYPSPTPSVVAYATGDQPWLSNQSRRFSSPALKDGRPTSAYTSPSSSSVKAFSLGKFARSSSDLRSISSPRSISPGRGSVGGRAPSERPGSLWSRFRRSDTQSVYSFAPSGSMMDMHLGLSMDKHNVYAPYETYPSMSDAAVARHIDPPQIADRSESTGKPKKKGIKGFFSKLIAGGDGKKRHVISASEPNTPYIQPEEDFDYPLAPPPPLSALANEPRYHQRSLSNSSVDSVGGPYTPASQYPRQLSTSLSPVPSRTSFQRPSNDYLAPDPSPPRNPSLLQRTDSPEQFYPSYDATEQQAEVLDAAHSVRKEKSLPDLPRETPQPLPFHPNMPYLNGRESRSAYSVRTPSLSPSLRSPTSGGGYYYPDPNGYAYDEVEVGGGRKSKAKSKVWSMGFNFGNGRKKHSGEEDRLGETAVHPGTLSGIQREGALVSVRF